MVTEEGSRPDESLRYSVKDGVFLSLMNGFTLDYFTPFLLLLGGSVRHVALLSALPNLFASLIQLKSPYFVDRFRSRKRLISIFILLQALMLPPMIAAHLFGTSSVAAFIAVATLFTAFGAFINPAWGSLMADLVREDKRGEYFGWRNKVLGLVGIASTFMAGFILYQANRFFPGAFWGFFILFAAAFVFRLVSWRYFNRMHEPELVPKESDYFSFVDFISQINTSNFARFVFYVSTMKLCVYVASPFFAVFMLRGLKFNYLAYTLVTVSASLAGNFAFKRWGVHADRVGNLKVLRLTSRLVAVIPILWLFNQNPFYLFAVQAFSGFSWAGFNLASSNFIYDAVSPGKRTRCIAYFNFLGGISVCIGSLIGGVLAQRLPAGLFAFGIMNVILISGLLRLAVAFLMPVRFREVREVEKIRSHQLFLSVLSLRPVLSRAFRGAR